jgi:hypothetical protein
LAASWPRMADGAGEELASWLDWRTADCGLADSRTRGLADSRTGELVLALRLAGWRDGRRPDG